MTDLLNTVKCSIHHGEKENYIDIEKTTFQLYCTICKTQGISPPHKNLIFYSPSPEGKICYKHETDLALFYCEDCAQFICKTCFAKDHRFHSCSTPELIIDSIQKNIQSIYTQLLDLKTQIDKSGESVDKMNTYYNNKKLSFQANLDGVNNRITKALNDKALEFSNEIESFFNGVDQEVETSVQKLDNNKKQVINMIEEYSQFQKDISQLNGDVEVCNYKKEKDSVIEENKKFVEGIQSFLKENLEKTKQKVINEEDSFNTKCALFKTNIANYEESVTNTILSGIPNICMRVRRFRRYTNAKSKYFKTDSLCLLTSSSINLAGFAFCGLVQELNSPGTTCKIALKIYELSNVQTFNPNMKPLTSIEVDLPVITNVVDPVYQFYLKNSVTISKEKLYYIILTNLSDLTFVNTWTGAVGKEIEDHINQHSVICNNSSVKFNFLNAFGVESDFNEFSEGIISDIIFSEID